MPLSEWKWHFESCKLRVIPLQVVWLTSTSSCIFFCQDHLSWSEGVEMASACYIASYAYEPPQEKASWFVKASDEDKKLYTRVIDSANFRASQTGKKCGIDEKM